MLKDGMAFTPKLQFVNDGPYTALSRSPSVPVMTKHGVPVLGEVASQIPEKPEKEGEKENRICDTPNVDGIATVNEVGEVGVAATEPWIIYSPVVWTLIVPPEVTLTTVAAATCEINDKSKITVANNVTVA